MSRYNMGNCSAPCGLFYYSRQVYDWVEYFAGVANATRAARLRGSSGCRLDLDYFDPSSDGGSRCKTNFMDLTSASGFWFPGQVTCGDFNIILIQL